MMREFCEGAAMTGIERLRKLSKAEMSLGHAGASSVLKSIADQIEREHMCDSDTAENVRLIVGGVVDEMERHVLGHEGMEDSPVARWARELRNALDGHEEEVTDVATVRKDAYDAYEWVLSKGGLEAAKMAYDMNESLAKAVIDELWPHLKPCETGNEEIIEELHERLLPTPLRWPKLDTGERVEMLGKFMLGSKTDQIFSITFYPSGAFAFNYGITNDEQHMHGIYGSMQPVKSPDDVDSEHKVRNDTDELCVEMAKYLGDYSPSDFCVPGDSISDRVRSLVDRALSINKENEDD